MKSVTLFTGLLFIIQLEWINLTGIVPLGKYGLGLSLSFFLVYGIISIIKEFKEELKEK
jgi:hypothetical protein